MKKFQTAADIMTKELVTIRAGQTVDEARGLMSRHNVRHLPVVGEEGLVIGIVSESDVLRALNPSWPGFEPKMRVADLMSWPALTVDEQEPLRNIVQGMVEEKVSALLVTRSGNEVIGIMTSADLLELLAKLLPETTESSFLLRNLPYTPIVHEALREMGSAGI
jgi:CBS domain-containing protein